MSSVEQIKLKRAGIGLRACDPARACPGHTLFTPMCSDGTVYLIDLQGEVVHTWSRYVNPHFPVPSPDEAPNNSVFRAFRYSLEEIERARETSREA